jgi:hypothetical protein
MSTQIAPNRSLHLPFVQQFRERFPEFKDWDDEALFALWLVKNPTNRVQFTQEAIEDSDCFSVLRSGNRELGMWVELSVYLWANKFLIRSDFLRSDVFEQAVCFYADTRK